MYENLRKNFQDVTGTALTLDDSQIEAAICASPAHVDAYVALATDEEKKDYIQRNIADITTLLVSEVNGTAGNAGANATTGEEKAAKTAVEPVAYNRLSEAKKAAIARIMSADRDLKRARSARATIDAVLIARPCPTEWMQGVPECPTDIEKAKKLLGQTYTGSIEDWLKSAENKAIIVPTAAQLSELAARHKTEWLANNPGKGEAKYKAPSWVTNTQAQDVQAVQQLLDSGAPFQVMVAGPTANEAAHVNAWKWATKGYVVTYPESLEGSGANVTKAMSVNGLRNFLLTEADGAIVAPKEQAKERMTAQLALVKKRGSDRSVQEPTTVVRVRNNNAKVVKTDMLRPITATTGGTKKMAVKSLLSFLVVQCVHDSTATGASAVHFRVTRRRLSLTWENGPEFKVLPEYENLPGLSIASGASNQGKLTSKQRASVKNAMENMYAQLASSSLSSDELQKGGLESIFADVQKTAAATAQAEAEQFT